MFLLPHELVLVAALAVAWLANWPVAGFQRWLRRQSDVPETPQQQGVPPWIVGAFERLLAFGVVYFYVEAAPTILALWIGAKLAANWQRREAAPGEPERNIRYHLSAARLATASAISPGRTVIGNSCVGSTAVVTSTTRPSLSPTLAGSVNFGNDTPRSLPISGYPFQVLSVDQASRLKDARRPSSHQWSSRRTRLGSGAWFHQWPHK